MREKWSNWHKDEDKLQRGKREDADKRGLGLFGRLHRPTVAWLVEKRVRLRGKSKWEDGPSQ